MMWARSSGAGAGNAVLGWRVDRGIVDIDDRQIAPVQPVGQPGGGDRGDRRGVVDMNLIRAGGCAGSIGRYAAPVLSTARIAMTA